MKTTLLKLKLWLATRALKAHQRETAREIRIARAKERRLARAVRRAQLRLVAGELMTKPRNIIQGQGFQALFGAAK
jgi:hypothetical protein